MKKKKVTLTIMIGDDAEAEKILLEIKHRAGAVGPWSSGKLTDYVLGRIFKKDEVVVVKPLAAERIVRNRPIRALVYDVTENTEDPLPADRMGDIGNPPGGKPERSDVVVA